MTLMGRSGMIAVLALAGMALASPAIAQTSAQQVAVLPGDAPGDYRALGVVSVEVHQKSMFPKTPVQQQLDAALRAEAAKLGADAVIQVKYTLSNAMTSKDGQRATGVAVKFSRPTQVAAAPAPVAAPAPAPAPIIAPYTPAPLVAPALATAPSFSIPATPAPPMAVAAAPVAPVAAPVRHAASPALVVLTDQDLPGQRYVRLGEVSAVTHQTSMFPKTPPLEALKSALQGEAHRMGADAVIQVKYAMANAMTSKAGNKAVGIAVRFE